MRVYSYYRFFFPLFILVVFLFVSSFILEAMAPQPSYFYSYMYRYGLLFMCAAAFLAVVNGGGKQQWDWMNQQNDLRRQQQKRIEQDNQRNIR